MILYVHERRASLCRLDRHVELVEGGDADHVKVHEGKQRLGDGGATLRLLVDPFGSVVPAALLGGLKSRVGPSRYADNAILARLQPGDGEWLRVHDEAEAVCGRVCSQVWIDMGTAHGDRGR